MNNLLLNQAPLPTFSTIQPEHIQATLTEILNENRQKLAALLQQPTFTWDNLMVPLAEMDNKLGKMWSPISHLHGVMESEALRTAYNACLPQLTEYQSEWMQNEALYAAVKSIAESPAYATFNKAQQKLLKNELRDFHLAGVSLSADKKVLFTALQKELSQLTTEFSEHVLDATQGWDLHVTDRRQLAGLPDQAIELAAQNASERAKTGWLFTLDYPSYAAIMKYLDNRELRHLMYEAYVTRASDQGPMAGKWDNTSIMENILKKRQELANLLGFKNYAAYSLATKMAHQPEQVLNFLNDLVSRSQAAGKQDLRELTEFAHTLDGTQQLEPWDLAYYSEKLRETTYALSQEELRKYFPVDKVLSGLFNVMERLLGIRIAERQGVDVWHPHVQFFEIYDMSNQLRGYFYTDLFARPHKRDGAWMDECRVRQRLADGTLQYPVAFLTCNFARPVGDKPAFLTHDDVQTVFHEFGHCLHHLLTQVEYAPLSGINGVPWDAVEFPSQFFEHWCWDRDALKLISAHETTGEPLPDALYDRLIAAKNFQSGLDMLRQLEFALFDFRLHLEFDPTKGPQVQAILDDVRKKVTVTPIAPFNRFQHSFSHIFAGGYAAGYYSYKWAEVLSSDAFSRFEEQGIFDRASGQAFMQNILEQGGVYEPMDLFIAFRGREPSIDALLRHSGLVQ